MQRKPALFAYRFTAMARVSTSSPQRGPLPSSRVSPPYCLLNAFCIFAYLSHTEEPMDE